MHTKAAIHIIIIMQTWRDCFVIFSSDNNERREKADFAVVYKL